MELINQDEQPEEVDFNSMFLDCLVDLDTKPKPLDVMVYYGYTDKLKNKRVPALTRGEFSCIVAMSKTKKSFNKSLIEACFMGGSSDLYTEHILSNSKKDGYIISVDTEQGEYYAHKTFNRTRRISDTKNPKYKPLQMRKLSIDKRLELIDWIVYESEYAGKIDLLVIDGVADLVYNTNDIKEGVVMAEKLLKWSSEGDLHLITVIHKTGSSDKARGHLGTAVQFKAETIILMDSLVDEQGKYIDRNTVKVRCGMSRGKNFNDFYLRIDEDGLPFTFDDPDNPVHPKNEFKEFKEEEKVFTATPQQAFSNDDYNSDDEIPF